MNVKAPYLPLAEACEIVGTLGGAWEGSEQQKVAHDEGWNIFNLVPGGEQLDAGIERYDEPLEHGCPYPLDFDGDEAVIAHCQAKIEANADPIGTYATALKIEHALNSIRFHVWGESYVDSRTGPSREVWNGRSSTLRNEQAIGIPEYSMRPRREAN
ncbi:MAG TPA: hypothetical protein H9899_07055 [Candidatus Sphingomonas excrementigallinarum]|nr:hypothetical protein [Candidatus Sphingomonas excrementigallinarum]